MKEEDDFALLAHAIMNSKLPNPDEKDPLITIRLSVLAGFILRDDSDRQIDNNTALIIEAKCKNKGTYHIQWPDKYNPDLTKPKLWLYPYWKNDIDRWEAQKKRSDEQRDARFVQEANVRLVAQYVKRYFMMDDNWATNTAFGLVTKRRTNGIREIGVPKLIERVDEIP